VTGPDPAGEASPAGRVLGGHYLVQERLGAGAMGVVHRARHTLLGRDFALKVLAPGLAADPEARARLLREGEALARITHPNVVPVRHVGEEGGVLFLVMDLCEGETLRDLLAREGPLEERRAVRIAVEVLGALDAAHWEGVVHRDLKPSNVLVAPPPPGREGGERVRVVDFGLSRVSAPASLPGAAASAPGTAAGSVAYMSPEQVRADADLDARSDLFSVGTLLHEMLGGRAPFEGSSTLTVAMQILERPPAPLPEEGPRGVSAPVRAVLARAMEKDRERRFPTASAMADALRDAIAGVAPAAPGPGPAARSSRLFLFVGACAAVGLAAFGAFRLLGPTAERPAPAPSYDASRAAVDREGALRSLLDSRFEAAAAAIGRVLDAGLGTGEDRLLLGRARAGLGDARALADLDGAAALLGSDPRPAVERARFLVDEGADGEGALRVLDAVLARGADADALFHRLRILAQRETAGKREVEPLERDAAALGGDPRRGLADALVAEARGDLDAALESARLAAEAHPDLAEPAVLEARYCFLLGNREPLPEGVDQARRWHERALRAIGEAVARSRRRPDLHLQGRDLLRHWRTACTMKYALGDEEGAAADYANEVLARNPSCLRDLGVGAQYHQWAGRFDDALRAYATARRLGAGDTHLHGEGFCRMQAGRLRAEAGDLAGALRELEASVAAFSAGIALRPAEPAFRTYRAEARLTLARIQRDDAAARALAEATEDFRALEAAAPDPEVLFRRWELKRSLGDPAGALADIRAAVSLASNVTAAYLRRLAWSCIEAGRAAGGERTLLEEAIRAADGAERWSPRRAELACLLRADARAALAEREEEAGVRARLREGARADLAKAASLARLDPRVRAEALLRSAALRLAEGDAAGALADAGEAMRLRKDADSANRSTMFVNDYYLRSPLAEFHARLAAAYAAAGRKDEAAVEEARARSLR
jgi:hypothetical protein